MKRFSRTAFRNCYQPARNTLLLLGAWSLFAFGGAYAQQTPEIPEPSASEIPPVSPESPESNDSVTTPCVAIKGQLLERGSKGRLPDVSVFILPHQLKTTTTENGHFEFACVPEGDLTWIVNLPGYEKLTKEDNTSNLSTLSAKRIRLYVEKVSYQGVFETTVTAKAERRDDATRSIGLGDILSAPGAGRDPIKAVQNLPGINRSQGFSANIVIQGSEENATGFLVDGHEVPLIFHFGGLSTVIFPEAVEQVDYLSAGYGPEYGRAIGGLVGIRTRNARRDRSRGIGFIDLINAGALYEGPLSKKSGLIVSARQSYIGQVLKAVVGDNEDFDFTVAPRYTDFNAIYDLDVAPNVDFRLTTVASWDKVEFLLEEPIDNDPALRGRFDRETQFFRFIPQLTWKPNKKLSSTWSLGAGWTRLLFATTDNFLKINSWSFTPRAEVAYEIRPNWKLYTGMDHNIALSQADVRLNSSFSAGGIFNPFSSGEEVLADSYRPTYDLSTYVRSTYQPDNTAWKFSPGARLIYFSETDEVMVDPRMAISYALTSYSKIRIAGGRYHQSPEPRETSEEAGNPDLSALSAWHAVIGYDHDWRGGSSQGWTTSASLFARYFDDLVVFSDDTTVRDGIQRPEFFNNSGSGRSIGAEAAAKYSGNRFNAQLAYTLLESRREEPGIAEYPAAFDQTHNINVIASWDLSNNWRIATRIRYVTGNPYTPVVGSFFDANNGVYIPDRGPFYSERLADFFQADFRVDKKWIFDEWILSLYLDIQNVTNRRNPEGIDYAFDYSATTTIDGLPVIPSLGIQGEF